MNLHEYHKRNEHIVALRLEGKKMIEIGDVYGITRERVRQLLSRAEKETGERLTGIYHKQKLCPVCSADITKMHVLDGKRHKYCSAECRLISDKSPKHDWADMIIVRRLSGESWMDISKVANKVTMNVHLWAKRWIHRLGLPANIVKEVFRKHQSGPRPHNDWVSYRASIKARNAELLEEWRKIRESV